MPKNHANATIAAHRRARLRQWIDTLFEGRQADFISDCFGNEYHIAQSELSGLLKAKSFGEKKARSIEVGARMPPFWLDKDTLPIKFDGLPDPNTVSRHLLAEEARAPYDIWTAEIVRIMMTLTPSQREGALATLRGYVQNLGPPRDGQALSMAA